jgi:hypothetical protein
MRKLGTPAMGGRAPNTCGRALPVQRVANDESNTAHDGIGKLACRLHCYVNSCDCLTLSAAANIAISAAFPSSFLAPRIPSRTIISSHPSTLHPAPSGPPQPQPVIMTSLRDRARRRTRIALCMPQSRGCCTDVQLEEWTSINRSCPSVSSELASISTPMPMY